MVWCWMLLPSIQYRITYIYDLCTQLCPKRMYQRSRESSPCVYILLLSYTQTNEMIKKTINLSQENKMKRIKRNILPVWCVQYYTSETIFKHLIWNARNTTHSSSAMSICSKKIYLFVYSCVFVGNWETQNTKFSPSCYYYEEDELKAIYSIVWLSFIFSSNSKRFCNF